MQIPSRPAHSPQESSLVPDQRTSGPSSRGVRHWKQVPPQPPSELPQCPAAPVAMDGRGTPSIAWNFVPTFGGNALFAACQWTVLSLIARIGGPVMLGTYALAVAVSGPVTLFAHLNLRAVLATDMERRHPLGDYLVVRWLAAGCGMAVLAGIAALSGYPGVLLMAVLLAGLVQTLDNFSDLYYGALQRRHRMDQVAASTSARGLLSLAALALTLWVTHHLLAAMAAQAAARAVVVLVYDRRRAHSGEDLSRSGWSSQASIARSALPLGIVLMLLTLSASLPRYAIERSLGTAELGAFAAVASFQTVGATVINALGQAATPGLASAFSRREFARFRRLTWQLLAMAAALGATGVAVAWLMGGWALRLVYGPQFAQFQPLLVWAMAVAVVNYAAGTLGYVITSARAFAVQAPLFAAVAATSAAASFALVPRFGMAGALIALAAAWLVQAAGAYAILRSALRRSQLSTS
jgi:O-antigen/teichoic acid export membrane protein